MKSADPDPKKRLAELRADFTPYFFWLITATYVLVALSVLCIVWIVFQYEGKDSNTEAAEKALMAQTIQTSLGMLIGLVAVAFGVVMTWIAIEAPFTFSAQTGADKPSVSFQSVSPGIALSLGGLLLIGFSLYLPMFYVKNTGTGEIRLQRQVGEPPPNVQ